MAGYHLSRLVEGNKNSEINSGTNELIWKLNNLSPRDPRADKPVASSVSAEQTSVNKLPPDWRLPVDPSIKFYSRHHEEKGFLKFSPSTRCEEWSTLRQMLPSRSLVRETGTSSHHLHSSSMSK